jgi:hypothetical protein
MAGVVRGPARPIVEIPADVGDDDVVQVLGQPGGVDEWGWGSWGHRTTM